MHRRRGGHPARHAVAVATAALLCLPLLLSPSASAAPAPRADETSDARARELAAAGVLENSSAAVQTAAAALSKIAAELPAARAAVHSAAGELIGARARVVAADAAVQAAEARVTAASGDVTTASAAVDQGRHDVGIFARQTYQDGGLAELQQVVDAGDPANVLERANQLRSVFRYRDASLQRLTDDRLTLAGKQADLTQQQQQVRSARQAAQDEATRVQQVAVRAQQAEGRVAELVSRQQQALSGAKADRAQDQQKYQQARDASQELAARIRAAAAAAAAQLRARQAAQAAADRAAADQAARQQAAAAAAAAAANQPPPPAPPAPRSAPAPSAPRSGGRLQWPCYSCPLTSPFGWRVHPIFGDLRFHAGVDMGAPIGTPVHAAADGVVTYAGYASGYGTLVVISHGSVGGRDLSTAYAHMSTLLVTMGQSVSQGAVVGRVGNEGNSTGPHLHFEVRVDGEPVDPLGYVSPP